MPVFETFTGEPNVVGKVETSQTPSRRCQKTPLYISSQQNVSFSLEPSANEFEGPIKLHHELLVEHAHHTGYLLMMHGGAKEEGPDHRQS